MPYMSPSEFDEVLARHQEASFTSRVHARLRATLQAIELRGRKPTRRNVIFRDGKFVVSDFMRAVGEWLNNYNVRSLFNNQFHALYHESIPRGHA